MRQGSEASSVSSTAGGGSDGQASPAAVTVGPETFTLVDYDAGTIASLAAELVGRIGLPAGLQLRIEVDELTPLGWSSLVDVDPSVPRAVLQVESGAFEDVHYPRQFSERATTDVVGRHLVRLHDRLDPGFGAPADDGDLPLPLRAAWDAYAVGRMSRLGYPVQRQRRLYQFRVRHGFTDAVDAAFDRLWGSDDLTWSDIERLSDAARDGQS